MTVYESENLKLTWGGVTGSTNFKVELAQHAVGQLSQQGTGQPVRRRVQGQPGVQAAFVSCGFSVQGTFEADDDVDTAIDNPVGFLAIEQTDSGRMMVIPAVLSSVPLSVPPGATSTHRLMWTQTDGIGTTQRPVIEGARLTSSTALSTGESGYLIDTDTITAVTSGSVGATSSKSGVKGTPLVGEEASG